MARPSKEDIIKLERNHKAQFVDLVLANRLFIGMLPKLLGKSKTSREYIAVLNYAKKIAELSGKWYKRQYKFETKGKVPPIPKDLFKYFGDPKNEKKLIAQAKMFLDPSKKENQIMGIFGIGIVPLIIWGVIILIAAFTAYEITDELNTTAEEKSDLLDATKKTLLELNVPPKDAAAIISQTQQEASAESPGLFGGGLGKMLLWGALAFGIYTVATKPKTNAIK